jgi:hypothetical protein
VRALGLLLVVLGIVAFAASRLAAFATLDVVLVGLGLILVLAGVALLMFGRPRAEVREERRAQRGGDVAPPVASPPPGAGPTGTGDRDLSSPVPVGPSSEPAATMGTTSSAPAPVVRRPDAAPGSDPEAGRGAARSPAPDVPDRSSE